MANALDMLSGAVLGSPDEQKQNQDQGLLGGLTGALSDLPSIIPQSVGLSTFTGPLGEGLAAAQSVLGSDPLSGRQLSGWEKAIPLAALGGLGLAGAMYLGGTNLWHATRPLQWSVDLADDRGAVGFGGPNSFGKTGITDFNTPPPSPSPALEAINAPRISEEQLWGTVRKDTGNFLGISGNPQKGWDDLARATLRRAPDAPVDVAHTQSTAFAQSFGDRLITEVPTHMPAPDMHTLPEQAPMAAAAYEMARWNSVVDRKIGSSPIMQGKVLKSAVKVWDKFRAGDELTADQTQQLQDVMVQFADGLQWVQHPELALHPLVGIAGLNADEGALQTQLRVLNFDQKGWDRITPKELNDRVRATLGLNPAGLVDHMRANITDFWKDYVRPDTIDKFRNWYPAAKQELVDTAGQLGVDPNRLTTIASILSAGENWSTNVSKAATVMKDLEPAAALAPGARAGVLDSLVQKMTQELGVKVSRDDAMRSLLVYGVDNPGDFFFTGKRTNGAPLRDLASQWEQGASLNELAPLRARGQDYQALKQPSFWFGIWHSDPADIEDQGRALYEMMRGEHPYPGETPINSAADFGADVRGALPVVVDRQAFKVALGVAANPETFLSGQKGANDALAQAYRMAAGEIGDIDGKPLTPGELQAITWMELRRRTNVVKPDLTDYATGERGALREAGAQVLPIEQWGAAGGTKPAVFNTRVLDLLLNGPPEPVRYGDFVAAQDVTVNPADLNAARAVRQSASDIHIVQQPDGTYGVVAGDRSAPETYRGLAPTRQFVGDRQALVPAKPYLVDSVDDEYDRLIKSSVARDQLANPDNAGVGAGVTKMAWDGENVLPWKRPGHWLMVAPLQEFKVGDQVVQTADRAHNQILAELAKRGIVPKSAQSTHPVTGIGGAGDFSWSSAPEQRVPLLLEFNNARDLNEAVQFFYKDPSVTGVPQAADGAAGYIRQYGSRLGLDSRRIPTDTQAIEKIGQSIAKAYDRLPLVATDEATQRSYAALVREVKQQYQYMTNDLGIRVEFVDEDPYPTDAAMMRDVRDNGTLKIYKTAPDQEHPYLTPEENDQFRAVHDFFGHAAVGNDFSRHGEEVAWAKHGMMFSKDALPAMTTETRGQNSYLNFSAQNEARRAQGLEAEFPPQKAALLPKRYWTRPDLADQPRTRTWADEIMPENSDPKSGESWVDVPSLFAYVNGPGEAPAGMERAVETHFRDRFGGYAFNISKNADVNRGNSAAMYIPNEFGDLVRDTTVTRFDPGRADHLFTNDNERLMLDGQAQVKDLEGQKVVASKTSNGLWGVKVDGRAPQSAVVSMPTDGSLPQVVYGTTDPAVVAGDPARTVVLQRSRDGVTVGLPGNKAVSRQLSFDAENFLRRVGVTSPITFRGY